MKGPTLSEGSLTERAPLGCISPYIQRAKTLQKLHQSILQVALARHPLHSLQCHSQYGAMPAPRAPYVCQLGRIAGISDCRMSSLNVATSAAITCCNRMSCWSMRVERS